MRYLLLWKSKLYCLAILLLFVQSPILASAVSNWPKLQVIKLIVPFGAGGGSDAVARVLAQHLGQKLGQSIVVENRPGAGGSIGAAYVARSRSDGYTLLLGSSSEVVQFPAVSSTVSYDPLKDFQPLALVGTMPLVIAIHSDVPAENVLELINYIRENPGKLNYGSAGVGSSTHLGMALFLQKNQLNVSHIPYRGSSPVVSDLVAGTLDMAMPTLSAIKPFIEDPRIRILSLSTADDSDLLPTVSGMKAAGVEDVNVELWLGILAPAGTPAGIKQQLDTALTEVLRNPELITAMAQQGAVASRIVDASKFESLIEKELGLWKQVVRQGNIQLD